MTDFAKRLDALMAELGLSNSDLAAKIWDRYVNSAGKNDARGKDRISVWRRGLSVPSKGNLAKLAKALGVEVSELMPEAAIAAKPPRLAAGGQIIIQIVAPPSEPQPLWSRDRMAAWMHDHCLDGEERYPS
jgi:transcriptional regulator with XRE-family HTH domain